MTPPTDYGRYKLLRLLAVGGMGEVWLAEIEGFAGFRKRVALKRLHPDRTRHQQLVDRLIVEAKVAVELTHAHIVSVIELGKVEDEYFIAMEFVEGPNAATLLSAVRWLSKHIPIEHVVHIAACVADALDYAHVRARRNGESLGIVHRDISPENILLSFTGDVKLADFGIARVPADMAIHQTKVGAVIGKPIYMAPEQARGEPVDTAADVYAFGAVLFELLTREKFDRDVVRAPSELRDDVPITLDQLVLASTFAKPEGRPSAREICDTLRAKPQEAPTRINALGDFLFEVFPPNEPTPIGADHIFVSQVVDGEAPSSTIVAIGPDAAPQERSSGEYTVVVAQTQVDNIGVVPRADTDEIGSFSEATQLSKVPPEPDTAYVAKGAVEHIEVTPPPESSWGVEVDDPLDSQTALSRPPTRGRDPNALVEPKTAKTRVPPRHDRREAQLAKPRSKLPFDLTRLDPRKLDLSKIRRGYVLAAAVVAVLLIGTAVLIWTLTRPPKPDPSVLAKFTIRVSHPSMIKVDGEVVREKGRRYSKKLPVGTHKVLVKHPEYGKVRFKVELEPNQHNVQRIEYARANSSEDKR